MPRSTLEPRDREPPRDRNFCHVAVPRKERHDPDRLVVWCDVDDDNNVVLNSAEGRAWPANPAPRRARTVTVMNMDNPLEYLSLVGRLEQDTNDGADDVIDAPVAEVHGAGDYDHSRDSSA